MGRLKNFKIMVGRDKPHDDDIDIEGGENEYCGGHSPNSQLPNTVQNAEVPLIEITCTSPIDGRYVTVTKDVAEDVPPNEKNLVLCEVEVYAEPSKCMIYVFCNS